ncbi:MAG: hypothetical protein K8R88_04350 [Armatimonadetes bacterium]|nr:hypothetical protein [Armatimonadota bacterium]
MKKVAILLAGVVSSAILIVLALPPSNHGWIAWFAFAPLLAVVWGRGIVLGFASGIVVSLVAGQIASSGIFYNSTYVGESSAWTVAGFVIFGLVIGLVGAVAGAAKSATPQVLLRIAIVAMLGEWASGMLVPVLLGLSQWQSAPMLFAAKGIGLYGVSVLCWGANLWVARCLRERVLLSWPIGSARGSLGKPVRVAMIQTQLDGREELTAMNKEAKAKGAEIAVWPELIGAQMAPKGNTKELRELSNVVPLITSFKDDFEPKSHNTAALFAEGVESQRYWKQKLFAGEVFLRTPGTEAVVVKWNDQRVGLNICFDTCYPSIIQATLRKNPDWLAAPTQDPNTSWGVVQAIHAAYTPFRAVETGCTVIRVDQTAYSMAVDADGHILASLSPGENLAVVTIDGNRQSRWLWFPNLALFCAVILAAIPTRKGESIKKVQKLTKKPH